MTDQFRASVTRSALSVQPQKPRLSSMFANLSKKTTSKKATVAKRPGQNQKKQSVKAASSGSNLKKSLADRRGQNVKERRAAQQAKSRQQSSGVAAPKNRAATTKKSNAAKTVAHAGQTGKKKLVNSKKPRVRKGKKNSPKTDNQMNLDEQLDQYMFTHGKGPDPKLSKLENELDEYKRQNVAAPAATE